MKYWILPLVTETANSAADSIPSGSGTMAATENAIENVQSVTSLFHLPSWVGRVVFILLVILITMQLLKIIDHSFTKLINRVQESGAGSGTLLFFVHNVVRVLVYFAAIVIVVYSIPGAQSAMNMLLASGGVIAVILSVAGKDALSNVAGGVMILTFKPFAIGDFVRYVDKDISGTVEEITLRHTVIRTAENKRLIIPNGTMTQSVLENANYLDKSVCEFFEVGITYESDLQLAIRLLREEVLKNPRHLDHRTPEERAEGVSEVQVRVRELGASSVTLRAWIWAEDIGAVYNLKWELNESVKNAFDKAGVEFAYPHITVVEK